MARSFNGSSDKIVKGSGTLYIGLPVSMSCWFKAANTTHNGTLVAHGNSANNGDRLALSALGGVTGDPVGAQHVDNVASADGNAFTTAGFSANVWHHACGVFTSVSSRTAYLDGGNSATDTNTQASIGIDRTSIGNLERQTPANFFNGEIAEVGIWNSTLTASEVWALSRGFAPPMVKPSGLICWMPLMGRNSPEPNYWKAGDLFTVTGTAQADHTRIIYPARPFIGYGVTASSLRRYNVFVAT
jgi:hypothetical protein